MLKRKSVNLKLISAISMVAFTAVACFSATAAWFVAKRSVDSSTGSFGVINNQGDITTISCYAIKYDGVYGASATKLISGQQNNFLLPEYDSIIKDRNINTSLFLRIEIAGFDKTKDLQISIPASGGYKVAGHDYIDNYLSNVICGKFSYGLKSGNTISPDTYSLTQNFETGSTVSAIYNGMKERVANVQGTPFVVNSTTKVNQIDLTIPHNEAYQSNFLMNTTIDGQTVEKVVVYIELDYYVTSTINLVQDYVDSYSGSGVSYSTAFRSDIGTMSLRDAG